ncbi:MAG: delta-60 repeat domain-containing protein [Rudaea sp.]|nr:delta-60 repeat domain-containing protein [Rudaea sp.]
MISARPQIRFAVHSVLLLLLLLVCALPIAAQVPLPNPNLPLVTNGVVNAIAVQPDGGVVFGGNFKSVNGVVRANLARLKADGTLDTDWNPAPDGNVYALAVDATSGAVYVGGSFKNIGGAARKNIAKLPGSGTATADANWNPTADNSIAALAVGSGGEVYAGGYFKNIGGAARNYIAKLTGAAGTADAAWNPSADSTVMALALNAAGDVYAGGNFQNIGALARNRVAKIAAATGVVDPTWDPNSASTVYTLAVNAGGDVYAGGQFTQIGGQTHYFIAKLAGSGNGAPDATWKPFAGGYVSALALDAAGNVVATGGFTNAATTLGAGQPRNYIARFAGAGVGTLDSWNPSMGGIPNAVAIGQNGTVYAGGKFPTVGSLPRLSFAGIDATSGVATAAVDAETNAIVNAIARQPNGGLIVAGDFLKAATISRQYILRLQADGSLDPNWHPSANGAISALATNAAGDVYAGGFFGMFGGVARTYIAKLAGADGTVDATWNPQSNGSVNVLAVDTDGSVYVGGGGFSTIGGQSRNYLAKLAGSGTGAADATWNPAANNNVYAFALDGAGNLFVGGDFTSIGGQTRNRVAKLTTTGSGAADATWNPSANSTVYALTLDASGNLLTGGRFSSFGGSTHRSLARAAGTGTGAVDATFSPTITSDVRTIALDATGAIFAGGGFFSIAGPTRNALAKFATDGSTDATWNPAPSTTVYALSIAAGGTVYAGGSYTSIGGAARNALAALNGTITYTVTPNVSGGGNGNAIAPNTPQTVNATAATTFAITLAAGYSVAVTDTCGNGGAGNGSYDAVNKIYTTGPISADCAVNAVFTPIPLNGSCGSASGQTFNTLSATSANLCTAGTLQNFAGSGPWTWTCAGSNGGSDATNCSASIASFNVTTALSGSGGTISAPTQSPVNYGSATTFTVSALPGYSIATVSGDHCTPAVQSGSTWSSGTITQACAITATFTANPINGVCGASNGQTLTAAPSTNLCSVGTPSVVAGNGHPWNWSCSGANGGSNASCTATIKTWTVTPSVAGSGGTINPAVPQTVDHGAALNFTVSPAPGY